MMNKWLNNILPILIYQVHQIFKNNFYYAKIKFLNDLKKKIHY